MLMPRIVDLCRMVVRGEGMALRRSENAGRIDAAPHIKAAQEFAAQIGKIERG
mgnify:CR=1 FL=1